ncbi:MAG: hypothetical protein E6Q97_29120 [Desulfurellales bacterium]|nr:MAG: hypothetical protein E6Q97_29120 [Desulfurellales bacterium]
MEKSTKVSGKTLVNQPARLELNGQKFKRVSKHKDLGSGISEGPFYQIVGESNVRFLYMPDLGFLFGKSPLLAMHRVQVASF